MNKAEFYSEEISKVIYQLKNIETQLHMERRHIKSDRKTITKVIRSLKEAFFDLIDAEDVLEFEDIEWDAPINEANA